MGSLYQTESFLTACFSLVHEPDKPLWENNSRCCSPIGHNHIFCDQSGANIHLTIWKWSGESRYPGALPPLLENFRRAFSPGPTDFLALFINNLHYKKKRPTTDSRKQGCVITIVLDFNNNNALIVNHSICTYRQDAIQYSLSVIEVIIHIFNWTLFPPFWKRKR